MFTAKSILLTGIFASVFLFSCENKKTDGLQVERPSQIRIVPTMHSPFADSNTVHCANVEYLWNAIMVNSDKRVSDNMLAEEFNKSRSWVNAMDTSKFVLAFGNPDDVYESIIRQYRDKYNIDKDDLSQPDASFWAYSDKVVNYKYAEPFDEQKLLFLGAEVSAFGFNSQVNSAFVKDHFKDQYDVLYYDTTGQFVVKLNPANSTDEIILTMLNQRSTFLEMFNASQALIKKGSENIEQDISIYNLAEEDELIVPVIKFWVSRDYPEVSGLKFSSIYEPIHLFQQEIHFNFDRKGVALEANVDIVDSVGMPQPPKLLHFNKPFYLYIKEADAVHPYFNLWIADLGILVEKNK